MNRQGVTTIAGRFVLSKFSNSALAMLTTPGIEGLDCLDSKGGGRKGDLSRFIEEAVRARVFDETARAIKVQNADSSPEQIDQAIDEALGWAKAA